MAKSINKAMVLGHLGKDPIVKTIGNTLNAKFSIATNYEYRNDQGEKVSRTEWHNIECWGPLAEIVRDYLKKGDRVCIEGRMRTTSREEEGITKYYFSIVASELVMLGGPNGGQAQAQPQSEEQVLQDDEIPF